MSDYRLTTERCVLRKLSRDDADHVWSAAHTPGFTDGMLWNPPKDYDEMHAFTDSALKLWDERKKMIWTIEDKETGAFIGRAEISHHDDDPEHFWHIGYWIHPTRQGKGYATEAARAIVHFAFDEFGAHTVEATHAPWNVASGRVMQKIGMTHQGLVEDKVIKDGQPRDSEVYRLERSDWEASRR